MKSVLTSDSSTLYKVWVTLHTCETGQALLLGLVPSKGSSDFIKISRDLSVEGVFHVMSSRMGVPIVLQLKVRSSRVDVNWVTNMFLLPWYGGLSERLVRNTKELLLKMLKGCWLNYEELQTVLLETETILKNRALKNTIMKNWKIAYHSIICCLEGH